MRYFIDFTIFFLIIQLNQSAPEIIPTLKEKAVHLDESITTLDLVWYRGSTENIEIFGGYKVAYCKIKRPNGRTTVIINEKCTMGVKVSDVDGGLWEVLWSRLGQRKFKLDTFNVRIADYPTRHDVDVSVSATDNQTVHLLCTIPRQQSDICLFTKPDGTVLNLPEKVENNKYEYYGRGYLNRNKTFSDCGVTIHAPSADDFGMWECSFGSEDHTITGFVSFIDPKKSIIQDGYKPNFIYVKTGESLTLRCPRYAPLKYCIIEHPANKKLNTPYISSYGEERALKYGNCEVTFENAAFNHVGNWTCILGVDGGSEVTFPNALYVKVGGTYLYTRKIMKNNKTTFTCNILPEKYAIINYCRWKGPKGKSLHIENSEDYITSYEDKTCSLTFNRYNQTNKGTWICYIKLIVELSAVRFDRREHAFMVLNEGS